MLECGSVDLVQLRRGYLRKVAASQEIASVQGAKPGKRSGGYTEMRSNDPALEWVPVRRSRRAWLDDVWVPVAGGRPMPDLSEDDEDNERWRSFLAGAAQRREERCARIAASVRTASRHRSVRVANADAMAPHHAAGPAHP